MLILMMLAMFVGALWWFPHKMREHEEKRLANDLNEVKRVKKLLGIQYRLRLAAIFTVVLAFTAVVLLMAGATGYFVFLPGMLSVASAIGWKGNADLLKVERIADQAKRGEAYSELRWRLLNLLSWLLGAIFLFQLIIWVLPTFFGLSLPNWMRHADSLFFPLYMNLGMFSLCGGLAGRLVRAEAHCARCDYPYDTVAKPYQCPECGVFLADSMIKHKRWVRSPWLIAFGAVALLLYLANLVSSLDSSAIRTMASISPTRGLIARLQSDDYNGREAHWAELQKRMPLAPADRDRLVEAAIASAKEEYGWTSVSTAGVGIWLGKELAAGPNGEEHFDQALEIIEKTDLQSDDIYNVDTLFTGAYATPVSALTSTQFDRLLKFTFYGLEDDVFNGWMHYFGGVRWLKAQSEDGRLTPAQEERLRDDAALMGTPTPTG